MPHPFRTSTTTGDHARLEPMGTVAHAMTHFPRGMYLLASAHDNERAGAIVQWVHQCCDEPPMIALSVRKGHAIEQLIRDSSSFSLAEISTSTVLVQRTFAMSRTPDEEKNQFDALSHTTLVTGAPILTQSALVFDCEMVRHVDLEADFEMYVGRVVDAIVRG